jgi:uncharacterized membrane protein YhhN
MKTRLLPHIFFIILLVEILGEVYVEQLGVIPIYVLKPFLMPILMIYYYQNVKNNFQTFDKFILGALFFSWWGDNFLMPLWSDISLPINFLAGLGSFLIAHLLYIPAFSKTSSNGKVILLRRPWLALPILLLVFGLISFLMNEGKDVFMEMKIPVVIYAGVISLMALAAINRFERVPKESFKWVMIGALMFVVSDSFIALSRFSDLFQNQVNLVRILIMALYAGGQFLIAYGAILQIDRKKKSNP